MGSARPVIWSREEEGRARSRLVGSWGHPWKEPAPKLLPLSKQLPFTGPKCPYRDHDRALAWWQDQNAWLRRFLANLPDPVAYQASRDTEAELQAMRLARLERTYPGMPKDREAMSRANKQNGFQRRSAA